MTEVRLRFCGRRIRVDVPDQARADALRAIAKALTEAETNPEEAEALLRGAATATPEKLQALQKLVAIDTAAGLPEAAPHAGPDESFAKYAERWFDDRERRGLSSVSTDRGRIVKHVNPTLGLIEIRAVKRNDLQALVERLDDSVRANAINWATAQKTWGLVTKLFDDACRGKVAALRVREDNPTRDVRGPDKGEPTAKQWLYPDEVAQLLAFAEVPLRWRRLYALATYLYLRPGELAALEWKDVHLDRGYVHIHQALDLRAGTDTPKATKTGISRKVPIHPSLAPLLAAMRPEDGEGRVVTSEHANRKAAGGMPPLEDLAATLREHLWRAGVRRADLHEDRPTTKRVTFYDLRSTGITWEVLAKTEPLRVQQRAGHTQFSTTQGYIRIAEVLDLNVGTPFPPLPACLLGAEGGPNGGPNGGSSRTVVHAPAPENLDETPAPVSSRMLNAPSNPVGDASSSVRGSPRAT